MANKSAKDLAFDNERAKIRSRYTNRIMELESQLGLKRIEFLEVNEQARIFESKCVELKEQVDKLLECMGLTEEDLKTLIQKTKDDFKFKETLGTLFGVTKSISLTGYR